MKNFYGNEEPLIGNLKPNVEIPPELKRKQQKEKHSSKQIGSRKKNVNTK